MINIQLSRNPKIELIIRRRFVKLMKSDMLYEGVIKCSFKNELHSSAFPLSKEDIERAIEQISELLDKKTGTAAICEEFYETIITFTVISSREDRVIVGVDFGSWRWKMKPPAHRISAKQLSDVMNKYQWNKTFHWFCLLHPCLSLSNLRKICNALALFLKNDQKIS